MQYVVRVTVEVEANNDQEALREAHQRLVADYVGWDVDGVLVEVEPQVTSG